MSFLESVIQRTKKMEGLLEERYQAVGKGLNEKTTSVEHQLDAPVIKQLRFIASVRNKLMHEDGYNYDRGDEGRFLTVCDEVIHYLFEHQTIIQTSYNDSHQSLIPILTKPQYTLPTDEISDINYCGINGAKPKLTRFKKFLIILGELWLFGFISTIVLNGVLFVIKQIPTQNQPENAEKAQIIQVNADILNSYIGQYDCKSYKITVSRTINSLKTSSSITTGDLTAVSESEFAANNYINGFRGRIKFTKNQKGKVMNLIILHTNESQEQCSKIR